MSTLRKVTLIVATAFLVGGALLAVGALAASGWNFQKLSASSQDWQQSTTSFQVSPDKPQTVIKVNDQSQNIRFEPSDGDDIEVEYWENSSRRVNFINKDGVLTIESSSHTSQLQIFDFNTQDHSTLVKVPGSFSGDIEASTKKGGVFIQQLQQLKSLKANTANDQLNVRDTSASSIELSTASGNVVLSGLKTSSLSIGTQNGNVVLSSLSANDITLKAKSGTTQLYDVKANSLDAQSVNGSITGNAMQTQTVNLNATSGNINFDGTAHQSFSSHTVNGSINVTKLQSDKIVSSTSSGNINIDAMGDPDDYAIVAQSQNGQVSAPKGNSKAEKSMEADTTNGNITLNCYEEQRTDPPKAS